MLPFLSVQQKEVTEPRVWRRFSVRQRYSPEPERQAARTRPTSLQLTLVPLSSISGVSIVSSKGSAVCIQSLNGKKSCYILQQKKKNKKRNGYLL